jgi:integrase
MPVPEALRPLIGKREIKRSLGTKDYSAARKLLSIERLKAQAEIEAAQRQFDIQRGNGPQRAKTLADDELWQLMSRWFVAREREASALTAHDVDVEARLEELGHLSGATNGTSAMASVHQATRKLLATEDIALDLASSAVSKLAGLIHEAMVEHDKRIVARFAHRAPIQLNPRFSQLSAQSEVSERKSISLRELADKFEEERAQTQHSPTAKLRRDAHLAMVCAVLGDETDIRGVTRDDAKRFRDVLARWPSNSTKRFPKLGVNQILALPDDKIGARLAPPTANAYLQTFCAMFDMAVQERLVVSNPARGLRFRGGGHSEADRHPFDAEDLTRIFNAPLYVGCENDAEGYSTPGSARPRRARFWIPLIALFTGLRLNEICMLREDDVAEVGGIPVLLLRADDPGKSLKTKAAKRLVPIQTELQKIGLVSHARAVREAHGAGARLFPDLTKSATGYTSNNFSKWFARFLDSVGVTHSKKTFHSFRHTFRDGLRLGGVASENAELLGGWSVRNTSQRYGGSLVVRARLLAPEVEKLNFEALDLSHLHSPDG